MTDSRKECPNGHAPTVHWGEEVDILYCMDCRWEHKIILAKRREGVKKAELSVRERGAGGKKPSPRRTSRS